MNRNRVIQFRNHLTAMNTDDMVELTEEEAKEIVSSNTQLIRNQPLLKEAVIRELMDSMDDVIQDGCGKDIWRDWLEYGFTGYRRMVSSELASELWHQLNIDLRKLISVSELIVRAAEHLIRHEDEEYWGTEDDISIGNAIADDAEYVMTEEAFSEWEGYCLKATPTEMFHELVTMLRKM